MNASDNPVRAIRGRQAASPRAKVSRNTRRNSVAAPARAGAFSTATARGSQNLSNRTPEAATQSVTASLRPAMARRIPGK